jgi:DNA replication protein DnaC
VALEVRRRCATVLFITAESLRQAVLQREMFDEDMTVYERAKTVDFLVVDDLGKEHPDQPGWSSRLFENLFRVRSAAKRATIVTTNMKVAKLTEEYEASMLEVMKETMYPIFAKGENRRNEAARGLRERLAV